MTAAERIAYPHISFDNEVRGGMPVVAGTRIPVSTLVRAHQLGADFDEILGQYPNLTPNQLHAAFLYFHDHKEEVEAAIALSKRPRWERAGLEANSLRASETLPRRGRRSGCRCRPPIPRL